jgi:chorismate synthase
MSRWRWMTSGESHGPGLVVGGFTNGEAVVCRAAMTTIAHRTKALLEKFGGDSLRGRTRDVDGHRQRTREL